MQCCERRRQSEDGGWETESRTSPGLAIKWILGWNRLIRYGVSMSLCVHLPVRWFGRKRPCRRRKVKQNYLNFIGAYSRNISFIYICEYLSIFYWKNGVSMYMYIPSFQYGRVLSDGRIWYIRIGTALSHSNTVHCPLNMLKRDIISEIANTLDFDID